MYYLFIILLLAAASVAQGSTLANPGSFQQRYLECLSMKDDIGRLRCYDELGEPAANVAAHSADDTDEVIVASSKAADPNRQRRVNELDDLQKRERSGMLQSDDPNYFVYTSPVNDDIDDEHHAEFYLTAAGACSTRSLPTGCCCTTTGFTTFMPSTMIATIPHR